MPDQQVWGQKLSDKADGYPVLTSEESKKVLKVTFATQDNEEYDAKYTNLNGTVEMPETPEKTNYTFEKWAKTQEANGEKFDEKTQVTEDITVYAVGRDHFGGDSADITLSRTYGYDAPITVNLDEHMKYANKSVASEGKFTYEISNKGNTNASIESENTLSVPTGLNADDYTITVTATGTNDDANVGDGKSVTITGVTVGGADAEYYQAAAAPTGAVTVNIEKADSTVVAPTGKTDLTYNGTAQELLATAGSATGGELQYKVDEGTYSTDAPKATTAGEHTVYYKVVENENYNGIAEASIKVTIAKATPTFDVTGAVKNNDGTAAANRKLTLKPLGLETTTDESGNYTFDEVEAGSYNIVVETSDGKTVTTLVDVTDGNVSADIMLPAANVGSTVETTEGTQNTDIKVEDIVVGGLDTLAETVVNELPEEDKTKDIEVKMTVESKPEIATDTAQQAIKQQSQNKTEKLNYIDIDIVKTVGTESENVTETTNLITIVIPFVTSGKTDITVYRYHDGAAKTFPFTDVNAGDWFYNNVQYV